MAWDPVRWVLADTLVPAQLTLHCHNSGIIMCMMSRISRLAMRSSTETGPLTAAERKGCRGRRRSREPNNFCTWRQ